MSWAFPASRVIWVSWWSLPGWLIRAMGGLLGRGGSALACLVAGLGGAQPVGVGAGLDDVGVVGEPVDDRGAEPRVGEGGRPLAEGGVGGDGDRSAFLPLGEHLEQQFGAAAVKLEVAQLVQAEHVDAAGAGDGA